MSKNIYLAFLIVIIFFLIRKKKTEKFKNKKISVDLFIPIYFEGNDERYELTKKMFRYLSSLRKRINYDINLSFTIVGCNNIKSKNLFNMFFNDIDDTYIPFNQKKYKNYYKNNSFKKMMKSKFNLGILESLKKNKNITLIQGSNDFISENFFTQLKKNYNPKKKQMYGINKPIKNNKNLTIPKQGEKKFITDNIYLNHKKLSKLTYMGGIIGFSNVTQDEFNSVQFDDEISFEKNMNKKFNIEMKLCNDVIFLNIKTKNDISNFEGVIRHSNNIKLDDKIKEKITIFENLIENN